MGREQGNGETEKALDRGGEEEVPAGGGEQQGQRRQRPRGRRSDKQPAGLGNRRSHAPSEGTRTARL